MQLSSTLQAALRERTSTLTPRSLIEAAEELSLGYREATSGAHSLRLQEAYLISRLPATYAAIYRVASELCRQLPRISPRTLLDIGAGPGTGMWVLAEFFPALESAVLIERERGFVDIGKALAAQAAYASIQSALWRCETMEGASFEPADLVLCSYSLGELASERQQKILEKAWQSCQVALLLIEPGTPSGFARIRSWRDYLIGQGAHILAPCPHAKACPMQGGDWCHFAQRVERTSLHRRAKGGTLGYEDEKFSYLIAAKEKGLEGGARILCRPERRSGHVLLKLCQPEGNEEKRVVSRRQLELYKEVKNLEWGDMLPQALPEQNIQC